jgi:hypothetical protein
MLAKGSAINILLDSELIATLLPKSVNGNAFG